MCCGRFRDSPATDGHRPALAVTSTSMKWSAPGATLLSVALFSTDGGGAGRVEVLRPVSGIAPHIVGTFYEPLAFQQIESGQYFVFDRRAHTVYGINGEATLSNKVVEIGHEQGRILQPSAFDASPSGTFVVADAPAGRERVQVFTATGTRLGGFTLPGRTAARVTLGNLVLNGTGSLQFTGQSIVMSQPESGSLITEYSLSGTPVRSIGLLRATGQERDRDVHLALNSGLPLVDARGGYYFIFQTGIPLLRKYDRAGRLIFERHIEGIEIDEMVRKQPTEWPRRSTGNDAELPLVPPNVRAASIDRHGNVWIAMAVPYTYVYDADGDKTRVVQFRAAGVIAPTSLFFAPSGRLLVTPGCYEFVTDAAPPSPRNDRSPALSVRSN